MELENQIQEHLENLTQQEDKILKIIFVGGGKKSPGFTALATKACVIVVIQKG